MSSFGTGTSNTGGSSIALTAFSGTNGVQAGTDGLVPGPSTAQQDYLLGAGGDWTLNIKGGIALAESSDRIATTEFVQDVVGNAVLGGNAQLSALSDVTIAGLADDQFLQYDLATGKWKNATLNLSLISDVNLTGLADGNTIVWDNAAGEWVPGVGGGGDTDIDWSSVANNTPRGRVGTAEDIAGLSIFLCSRAGAFTVGEVISCDGGVAYPT